MVKKKTKRRVVKKVLIFFLLVFAVMSLYSAFKVMLEFIETKDYTTKTYTNSGKIDYGVYLDKTKFYDENPVSEGRSYITSLTNNLNMTLNYEYSSDITMPLKYNYMIKATLYGLYNQDPTSSSNPVLWDKQYIIKETTGDISITSNKINIAETINVNIRSYINEIIDFINTYEVATIAYVKIEMPITVHGESSEYSVNEVYNLVTTVAVEDKVFMLQDITPVDEVRYLNVTASDKALIDNKTIAIYIIIFLTSFTISLVLVKKIINYSNVENYEKKLEKIKIDFSEIIILTNNMLDTKGFKIVSIISFEELLNLATNLQSSIMLYEEETETSFYIINNGIVYLYLLSK